MDNKNKYDCNIEPTKKKTATNDKGGSKIETKIKFCIANVHKLLKTLKNCD